MALRRQERSRRLAVLASLQGRICCSNRNLCQPRHKPPKAATSPSGARRARLRGAFWLLGLDADPNRTSHAGAAKPAIAVGILCKVLLMIVLGKIEGRRVQDFRGDGPKSLAFERLCVGCS